MLLRKKKVVIVDQSSMAITTLTQIAEAANLETVVVDCSDRTLSDVCDAIHDAKPTAVLLAHMLGCFTAARLVPMLGNKFTLVGTSSPGSQPYCSVVLPKCWELKTQSFGSIAEADRAALVQALQRAVNGTA